MDRRWFVKALVGSAAVTMTGMPVQAQGTPVPDDTGTLFGNAFDLVPDGEANTVSVVAFGVPVRETVPVVVRNTTDETVGIKNVVGVARDASGTLIGTVESSQIAPYKVEAGGIAVGIAYFGAGNDIAEDAVFEFEVEVAETMSKNVLDLTIAEVAVSEEGILGIADNPHDQVVMGPIKVYGVVFAEDGTIQGYCGAYADKNEVAAGTSTPFDATFYGDEMTDLFLIASTGWADF